MSANVSQCACFNTANRKSGLLALLYVLFAAIVSVSASAQTAHFAGAQTTVYFGGSLDWPGGVAVDALNRVYVCDEYDNRVLQLTNNSGQWQISNNINLGTIQPYAVAVDASFNLFIANSTAQIIEESPQPGGGYAQSALIGNDMLGPDHIAIDTVGNLYIDNTGHNEFMLETNNGGGSYSQTILTLPTIAHTGPIVVDPSGNIFVTDGWTWNITKLVPGGGTYTPYPLWNGQEPTALALDAHGNLFFSTYYYANQHVIQLTPTSPGADTYSSAVLPSEGTFDSGGLAVDSNGNLFWDDFGTSRLFEFSTAGTNFGALPVGESGYSAAVFFQFDSSGFLNEDFAYTETMASADFTDSFTGSCVWDTSYGQGDVCTVDVEFAPSFPGSRIGGVSLINSSGAPFATANLAGYGLGPQINFLPGTEQTVVSNVGDPVGLALNNLRGDVFYTDLTTDYVYDGVPFTFSWGPSWVQFNSSGLVAPAGIALDGYGDIFVADSGQGVVYDDVLTNGMWVPSTPIAGLGQPWAVALDSEGNVYVSDLAAKAVYKFTLSDSGVVQSTVATGLDSPQGLAVDPSGNIFISDSGLDQVLEETPTATGYNQAVVFNQSNNGLSQPLGIASDAFGNIFIADSANARVLRETLGATGYIQTVINVPNLITPAAVGVDSKGNLYVSDIGGGTGKGVIYQLDFSDPPSLTFANTLVGAVSSDSPQVVSVLNQGNAPLNIEVPTSGTNPLITGAFVYDADGPTTCPMLATTASAPITLAPGASCGLPISFAPNQVATLSGTLQLVDNNLAAAAPLYATQTINLSGTGVADLGPNGAPTTVPALMVTPVPTSVLSGPSITFNWTPGHGPTGYMLKVGTTGAGTSNIYNGAKTTATSATLSNIPVGGSQLYVRLSSLINNVWSSTDYIYTQSGTAVPPSLTSPAPSSILTGASQTFQWNPGSGSASFEFRVGTTGVGSANLYSGGPTTGTSVTLNNIPTGGAGLYVRLLYELNGAWHSIDYLCTESGAFAAPSMSSPTPNSTLPGSTVDFQWNPGSGSAAFELRVGTTGVGSSNIYAGGSTANTSVNLTNVPATGANLYVRLLYQYNLSWHSIDYFYTQFGATAPPALTNPAPGSTLSGSSVNFQWNPGAGSAAFELRVGTTGVGSSNIYSGGAIPNSSVNLTNIPTTGANLYVRLLYELNGTWHSIDYVYTQFGAIVAPSLTNPTLGSPLPGSNVTFQWNPGSGATSFELRVGTTGPGASNLYNGAATTNTSVNLTNIPTTGGKVYVRLLYFLNGSWKSIDYTYLEQ